VPAGALVAQPLRGNGLGRRPARAGVFDRPSVVARAPQPAALGLRAPRTARPRSGHAGGPFWPGGRLLPMKKGPRVSAGPLVRLRTGRSQFVSTVWLTLCAFNQRTVPPGFTFAAAGENPDAAWLRICTSTESFADVLVTVTFPTIAGWIEQW